MSVLYPDSFTKDRTEPRRLRRTHSRRKPALTAGRLLLAILIHLGVATHHGALAWTACPLPRRRTLGYVASVADTRAMDTSASERDAQVLELVRDAMVEQNEAGVALWQQAVLAVSSEIFPDNDRNSQTTAELCLAEAFGWKRWVLSTPSLRKYQSKPTIPDQTALRESMDWLQHGPLQLQIEQRLAAVIQYPTLYLKDPQTLFRRAIQSAPREYRSEESLAELVRQDPAALDLFYNCGDDDDGCASNCGNCWVAYQRRF